MHASLCHMTKQVGDRWVEQLDETRGRGGGGGGGGTGVGPDGGQWWTRGTCGEQVGDRRVGQRGQLGGGRG